MVRHPNEAGDHANYCEAYSRFVLGFQHNGLRFKRGMQAFQVISSNHIDVFEEIQRLRQITTEPI